MVYNDGMKDVNIIEALFDKYSNEEMIHYLTKQLSQIAGTIKQSPTPENMYRQMGSILQLSEYMKAVDARINRIEKTPTVA